MEARQDREQGLLHLAEAGRGSDRPPGDWTDFSRKSPQQLSLEV